MPIGFRANDHLTSPVHLRSHIAVDRAIPSSAQGIAVSMEDGPGKIQFRDSQEPGAFKSLRRDHGRSKALACMMPPKVHLRSTYTAIAFFACLIWMSGCVSFDDVTQLSKLADSAQETFPIVVADIPASCERQNTILSEIPSDERPPSLAIQDCKPYQDVADHLTKDQGVLIAYFDALGKLASNTPLSYDQAIDANVAAIGKLPNLSSETVAASTAAQTLMKLVADEATAGYRKRKITSLVEKANPSVQELTVDLKKAIVGDYGGILSNESAILDIYYQSPIAAAKPAERLSLVLVQRQYQGDQVTLRSKVAATIAYGKAMDSLASLHSKLMVEATKKASLRDLAKDLGPDLANLKTAISSLQTELK